MAKVWAQSGRQFIAALIASVSMPRTVLSDSSQSCSLSNLIYQHSPPKRPRLSLCANNYRTDCVRSSSHLAPSHPTHCRSPSERTDRTSDRELIWLSRRAFNAVIRLIHARFRPGTSAARNDTGFVHRLCSNHVAIRRLWSHYVYHSLPATLYVIVPHVAVPNLSMPRVLGRSIRRWTVWNSKACVVFGAVRFQIAWH